MNKELRSYFSKFIYLSIIITIVLLVSGCPCKECDVHYPLTTSVNCGLNCEDTPGYVVVTQGGDTFVKGEVVEVKYVNIDPNYEFAYWSAYPPDILLTNLSLDIGYVQIKDGPQHVTAHVGKKKVNLTVECDINPFLLWGNRLNVPGNAKNIQTTIINGEPIPWRYEVEYDRGDIANVSVLPASNFIIDWHGSSVCIGRRYMENPVQLLMVDDIYIKPVAIPVENYNWDYHEMLLSIYGGDGIYFNSGCPNLCSYLNPDDSCNLGFYLNNYARSYGKFTFAVVPGDDKTLALWYCTSDNLFATSIIASANFRYTQNQNHSATALLVNKVYLNLPIPQGEIYFDHQNCQRIDEGGTAYIIEPGIIYPPTDIGPSQGWNPVPYTPQCNILSPIETFSPCSECNRVVLHASPCQGAVFNYWEVSADGQVWKKVESYNDNLTLFMNIHGPFDPVNEPNNIHIPAGCTQFFVRPVFRLYCGYGYECVGCMDAPDGRDIVIDMYNNPDVTNNNQMYTENIPTCCDFVTNDPNSPLCYTKEALLPFNKLECDHGNLPYPHTGWAIEKGVADCYAAVNQAYDQQYGGTVNVTSVYRCPKNNTAANGARTSKHLSGKAFDYDQLSSLGNWRVGKIAYEINKNYEILLYTNDGRKSIQQYVNPETGQLPDFPPSNIEIYHGHVGT